LSGALVLCPEPSDGPVEGQVAYVLRARTRWLSQSQRERSCGVMCIEHVDDHPAIIVKRDKGIPEAQWSGILTCGHIWTCPVCSQRKKAERAERISLAVGHLEGRWQMLTITLRHRQGLALQPLRDGLMAAWRKTRQGGRIQRVWEERVTASIRTQEVTYGDNGWHPHIHVLLRTTEWDEDERDALQARWERNVVAVLGEHARPDDLHGLVWSHPFDATKSKDVGKRELYLAKLGLESASLGKEGRRGGATPWDIARRATRGDSRAVWLWREYCAATKGKRMIELDDRAAAAAKRALELSCDPDEPEGTVEVTRIEVQRDEVRALRHLERTLPAIMVLVLRAAEAEGGAGVRRWVAYARSLQRRYDVAPAPSWLASTGPPP
jgi:hypothetical protein